MRFHRFVSSLSLFSLLGWSIDARLLLREGQDDGKEEIQLTKYLRPGRRTEVATQINETAQVQEMNSTHTLSGEAGDQGEERIYVKYANKTGHDRAVQHATKVHQDADDDDVVIMSCLNCLTVLRNDSSIVDVSIDHPIKAFGNIVGPARTLAEIIPWGLHMIQADQLIAGGDRVKVCIVDTGLAVGHPDFNYDFISGTDTVKADGTIWRWSVDKLGHGTHVAGTIAALAGNNIGVAGGGNFSLHITRALGDNGRGYESDVRRAVSQCIDAGSNIINLSLGGPSMSNASSALYTQAVEELGILMIAAAGNTGSNNSFYPASHPSVISVAAVYDWGLYWGGSNWGDQIEMAGPGYNILSSTVSTRSVQTAELGYAAFAITGGGNATGNLTYCGEGDYVCAEAAGGICLLLRESEDVTSMLINCQEGGAVGAVVYPGERSSYGNWTVQSSVTIQAVQVSWEIGAELDRSKRNTSVTIGDANGDGEEFTYSLFTGTSMASPHVAAAAALAWSYNLANCTNHQIRYALAKTALDLDTTQQPGCDNDHGYGLVQALTAKEWLEINDCSTWEVPGGAVGGCTILGESTTLTR